MKCYALYKGDQFLIAGTKKELAEYLGVKEKTIYFYTTEVYKKRIEELEKRLKEVQE